MVVIHLTSWRWILKSPVYISVYLHSDEELTGNFMFRGLYTFYTKVPVTSTVNMHRSFIFDASITFQLFILFLKYVAGSNLQLLVANLSLYPGMHATGYSWTSFIVHFTLSIIQCLFCFHVVILKDISNFSLPIPSMFNQVMCSQGIQIPI